MFFQIRHTDGKQIHEKVPNNTNDQRNTNQNHNVFTSHPLKWLLTKRQEVTSIVRTVDKKTPVCFQ